MRVLLIVDNEQERQMFGVLIGKCSYVTGEAILSECSASFLPGQAPTFRIELLMYDMEVFENAPEIKRARAALPPASLELPKGENDQ